MNTSFIDEEVDFTNIYDENSDDETLDDFIEFEDDSDFDDEEQIEIESEDNIDLALTNELKVPEYARRKFDLKGQEAIPMAKMKDGSYLMKIDNKYKKYRIEDFI